PHPENIEVAWVLRDRAMKADPEGNGGLATWDKTRPAMIEAEAVQRASMLSKAVGAPLYIVHTSSAIALETGLMQRQAGTEIYLETCPHYLTHDISWTGGEVGKINPPLRHLADRERLWQAIGNGEIDTVATDHVHRQISAKEGGIWKASPGCPGMETLLPIMLTEGYHARGISLSRIVKLLSENPARIMGLGHCKGRISVGMDADLAIVNLDDVWTFNRDNVVSSAGYSIYEGWVMKARVRDTLVRGNIILRNGEPVAEARGQGRFVPRYLNRA
ncbi:MAG: dihydroorotase family protein, partial [Opitutae bacterium]